MYAEADAGGETGVPPPPLPLLSSTASASITDTYYSTGPPRLGLIEFSISLGYLNAIAGSAGISDGVHNYPGNVPPYSCGFEDCEYTATVPFNLGTRFQASAATSAGVQVSSPQQIIGQDTDVAIAFELFEANGTTPVPVFLTSVPEPSTGYLLLFGVIAGACFLLGRAARKSDTGRPMN